MTEERRKEGREEKRGEERTQYEGSGHLEGLRRA